MKLNIALVATISTSRAAVPTAPLPPPGFSQQFDSNSAALIVMMAAIVAATFGFLYLLRRLDVQWACMLRLTEILVARTTPQTFIEAGRNGAHEHANHGEGASTAMAPTRIGPVLSQLDPAVPVPKNGDPIQSPDRSSVANHVPIISIANNVIANVHHYVSRFLRERGEHLEAGGVLVGEYHKGDDGNVSEIVVTGFIDGGPNVRATAGSIDFDLHYINEQLRALRLQHPNIEHVGAIHRHPGSMTVCSSGDEDTDSEAVRESPYRFLAFGIITIGNSRPDPLALTYSNFTINCYVMGEATNFQYVPVRPILKDLPVVEASPALRILSQTRATSALMDMAVLRSIREIKRSVVKLVDTPTGPAALCMIDFIDKLGRLVLLCRANGSINAEWQSGDGEKRRIRGPWDQSDVGPHVWVSHVALHCLAIARNAAPISYGSHHAWHDANRSRLVAEHSAMIGKYGERVKLHRRGDELFWTYTVKESGRELPVNIVYPSNFPSGHPEIVSLARLPSSPHQLPGNRLCWTNGSEWSPSRDTAAICIPVAHRWFASLLIYLTKGAWPNGADD